MHTHYDNLKVTRGAPAEVIRAAYKALSQRYHPDKNPSPDAQRIMRIINEAYAVLGDPDRRTAYDRELAAKERETPKVQGPAASASASASAPRAAEAAHAAATASDGSGRAEPSWFGARASSRQKAADSGRQAAHDASAAYHALTKTPGLPRKTLVALILFIAVVAAWIVWHASPRFASSRIPTGVTRITPASTTWTNPVSHAVATIDGMWKLSVTGEESGQTVYTFTETNGSAAIVFAREDLPDVGFNRYIPAYIRNNAHIMPLGAPGIRETVDGQESWSTDGHLFSAPSMKTHVELRHIGTSFWRLVVVQSQPYEESDGATRALKAQLWATLAGL